jgi:hypothetical protein
MLAAEAISDIVGRGFDEQGAFASYEAACRKTFRASFLAGGAFRKVMRTNALDWVVRAGQNPAIQSVTAKLLASI